MWMYVCTVCEGSVVDLIWFDLIRSFRSQCNECCNLVNWIQNCEYIMQVCLPKTHEEYIYIYIYDIYVYRHPFRIFMRKKNWLAMLNINIKMCMMIDWFIHSFLPCCCHMYVFVIIRSGCRACVRDDWWIDLIPYTNESNRIESIIVALLYILL